MKRDSSQFSLRAMMLVITVVAVLCCVFFTLPDRVGGLILLILGFLLLPATLAALVYGTGRTRAFALGASPPICIAFLWFAGLGGQSLFFLEFGRGNFDAKSFCVIGIFVVVVSGYVGQAVCWWCTRTKN